MLIHLRDKSQITLPSDVIKKMKLKKGDTLDVILEKDKIIIKPVITINREQSWFWSKEWQELEKEVEKNKKEGKIFKAKNTKDLFEQLDS